MTNRIGFLLALRLHVTAAFTGGSVLALGFLAPMLLTVRRIEDLFSLAQFAMATVMVTLILSAPFSLIFCLFYSADRTLTKPLAALYGVCTAVGSFFLLFVIARQATKFSGDVLLTLGLLSFAGAMGGLLFRWRWMAAMSKLAGKN